MANVSRINGFRPVKHLNGSPYNGQANLYALLAADATATFVGDLVKLSGTASADGYASVAQAAAGNAVIGAVVGFVPDYSNLSNPGQYRLASTLRYVWVADSPDLVFECQSDNGGAALAITDVGRAADIAVGSGSTTTGQSAMVLDSSTAATNTSTFPLKVLGFSARVDNSVGTNDSKVLVMINAHQLTSGAGIAGI